MQNGPHGLQVPKGYHEDACVTPSLELQKGVREGLLVSYCEVQQGTKLEVVDLR